MISLKNDALLHQPEWQGIFQKAGKVNIKTSWISSSNNNALWYNEVANDWIIGPVDYLGSSTGGISSAGGQGRSSCPYTVSKDAWVYVGNSAWIIADANDVSVECLTGKLLVT